jgi:hypothetical protein
MTQARASTRAWRGHTLRGPARRDLDDHARAKQARPREVVTSRSARGHADGPSGALMAGRRDAGPWPHRSYLVGGLFPRPPPDGLPVVLGPFGGRGVPGPPLPLPGRAPGLGAPAGRPPGLEAPPELLPPLPPCPAMTRLLRNECESISAAHEGTLLVKRRRRARPGSPGRGEGPHGQRTRWRIRRREDDD